MKITLKLPGGGYLKYEKKPMSEEAREDMFSGLMFICIIGAVLVAFWMFR